MNILFLDIDGVLNDFSDPLIHRDKVEFLEPVILEHSLYLILSSNWRLTRGYEWIRDKLCAHGMRQDLADRLIGETNPEINGRGEAIRDYLMRNKYRIRKWAVIDDNRKMRIDNMIRTAGHIGLTSSDARSLSLIYHHQGC